MTDRIRRIAGRLAEWVDELRRREAQLALVLSLVIGVVVGLVVVAFILLTGRLAAHLYPAGGLGLRRILVPVTGSLLSGFFLYRYFPDARGSGIPQTKAALYIRDGRITLRTIFGKFFCCTTSLASGIALGREGPSVQIGAGIASVMARKLRLSSEQVRALIPVGGAAALAAAFNTPIAAVLFSLEEIVGDLHAPVLGSVVISSATSWITLHLLLGDEPLFHVAAYQLVSAGEFIAYAVLGVACGVASAAFCRLLLTLRRRFLRLPARTRWWQPVVGGLTVGVMGFFLPDVLGVGYPVVEKVLGGNMLLQTLIVLAVLKIIATAVCYASGNAGGIFGPSLFIGAMVGGAVGHLAHAVAPMHTAGAGAYALVGMGAVFAGIVRTPLTSVIMVFEMTRDYSIIVPLMIANLIAFFVSHRLQRAAIYEALAHQDGIHLPTGGYRTPSRHLRVAAAMGAVPPGWSPPRPTSEAHVHADHGLDVALRRMGEVHVDVMPVVRRDDIQQIIGVVTLPEILRAYGVDRPPQS
ncbi:MAG TPA: chloride channel protein [Gemmatimonadales bacterium]